MAIKKRVEQLDKLLDWEREGRLFDDVDLFNKKVSTMLSLREMSEKRWLIEYTTDEEDDNYRVVSLPLSHKTLINLALSILDAVTFSEKR